MEEFRHLNPETMMGIYISWTIILNEYLLKDLILLLCQRNAAKHPGEGKNHKLNSSD